MPSALEQRTGRVDRIHSLAHRQLDQQTAVTPDQFLQVYYPHLQDTVERVQVERVYERMNRFLRMLHRSFGGHEGQSSRIHLGRELIERRQDIEPIRSTLQSAGIRLGQLRPDDIIDTVKILPEYVRKHDLPYSILNDLDLTSERVQELLATTGLDTSGSRPL